jgi:transposase-like protein
MNQACPEYGQHEAVINATFSQGPQGRGSRSAPDLRRPDRRFDAFEGKWGGKQPSIAPVWHRPWAEVTPFYAFSVTIRKIIYTTNAVEPMSRVLLI